MLETHTVAAIKMKSTWCSSGQYSNQNNWMETKKKVEIKKQQITISKVSSLKYGSWPNSLIKLLNGVQHTALNSKGI
jgi:ribosomal protein L33